MSALKTRFAAQAARKLRTNSTDAERKLWYHLRDKRLLGFKFVRQQPVGPFIADFACREADLIVELDGGQHTTTVNRDNRRTAVLAGHGYAVLRFWNNDVLNNTEGVLQTIMEHLAKAPSPGLRFAKSDLPPFEHSSQGLLRGNRSTGAISDPSGAPQGRGEEAAHQREQS